MTKFWISPDEKLPEHLQIVVIKKGSIFDLCVFVDFEKLFTDFEGVIREETISAIKQGRGPKNKIIFAKLTNPDMFLTIDEIESYFPLPEYFRFIPDKILN